MRKKQLRYFLCGFLIGACGRYWWVLDSGGAVRSAAEWLQYKADVYRATHDVPEADSGW